MSEATIIDHGYIPEEHAPDPVIHHGDPVAPGKIGIWLFLSSEIMFFVAMLGSYVIIRAGSPVVFARQAEVLSKGWAALNTLVLLFSSLTMAMGVDAAQRGDRRKLTRCLAATLLCALGFMCIKGIEYTSKAYHRTIVAKDEGGNVWVYDGHVPSHAWRDALAPIGLTHSLPESENVVLTGYRMPMPSAEAGQHAFDIHLVAEADVREKAAELAGVAEDKAPEQQYTIRAAAIGTQITYGPWKSIFFASYFLLTGIHGFHVLCGIIPLGLLCLQSARGRIFPAHTEYVGLYWHFVDLIWIFLFPLLYLI